MWRCASLTMALAAAAAGAEPLIATVPRTIDFGGRDGERARFKADADVPRDRLGAAPLVLDCTAVLRMQDEVRRAQVPRTVPAAPVSAAAARSASASDADMRRHSNAAPRT
jgi:hypothetical protein